MTIYNTSGKKSDPGTDTTRAPDTHPLSSTEPMPAHTKKRTSPFLWVGIACFAVLYIAINIWIYLYKGKSYTPWNQESKVSKSIAMFVKAPPTPTPTPTPIQLHEGKGTYAVSQSKHEGPSFAMVTFDPLDARKGQVLTLIVSLKNPSPITSVSATLQTDGAPVNLTFQHMDETQGTSNWQASTTLIDTLWYRYILTTRAVSSNGISQVTVAPRGE